MHDYRDCAYPGHRKVKRGDIIHCIDCDSLVAAGRMEPPERKVPEGVDPETPKPSQAA